tara:strand:+ start:1458 stop:1838 length:381 start_codon:yes stop_codon:yes gene_type:complete
MVVIKYATYINRCPFSKKLIKPKDVICLFNQNQFEAFKKIIYENLKNFLPDELISLIIEMTKYKTFIGKFGHKNVSHWTIKNKKYKKIFNTFTEKDYDSIIDLENQLVIEDISDSDNSDSTNYYSD